jgi:hypothetical protein
MLMVLMALADRGRERVVRGARWLWLTLAGGLSVTAPMGCESSIAPDATGGDAPPVADGTETTATDPGTLPDACCDVAAGDAPQFDAPLYGVIQDATDPGPQPLYGPAQVDAIGDTPTDIGYEQPVAHYGPINVDAMDVPPDPTSDQPLIYYGPVFVDAVDVPAEATTDFPVAFYGPQPAYGVPVDAIDTPPDGTERETPMAYYGPQPAYGAVPTP